MQPRRHYESPWYAVGLVVFSLSILLVLGGEGIQRLGGGLGVVCALLCVNVAELQQLRVELKKLVDIEIERQKQPTALIIPAAPGR